MLCYLIYINNTKIHFTTSYVPNSKFKLHRTCKFCHTYKLQHTHYFFQAKTGLPHILVLLLLQWSCQTYFFFFFFFFPKKMECGQFTLTDSVSECAKNRKLFKTWGHAHSISCACAQTPAKAFRSAINHTHTHKSNMQLLLFHQDMDLFSCYYLRDGCCWLLNWSYVNTYSDSESY